MIPANFDLNLLRVLDVLFEERSVTRAGERLGRTQSAVSNSLSRLRTAFGDPLLVRGPGGLVPTPKARALEPQIREVLRTAGECFDAEPAFDPASAGGLFRIGAPDRLGLPVAVPLIKELRRTAPGIEIDLITADRENALTLVDEDRIDVAVGWFERPPTRFRATLVFRDRLVCLVRADHPLCRPDGDDNGDDNGDGAPAGIDGVLSWPHLVVSSAGDRKAGFDDMLARIGIRRHAAISVTNFTTVPDLLSDSDLVGVFTTRIAALLARRSGLAVVALPAEISALDHYMVWHGRNDASPRHAWLRDRIREACETQAP